MFEKENFKYWKKKVVKFVEIYHSDFPEKYNLSTELEMWEIFWSRRKSNLPNQISSTIEH